MWLDDGDILGILFSEDYEILYTSIPDVALPTTYQDGYDSINHSDANNVYHVPVIGWPSYEDFQNYASEKVAASVSLEGAILRPKWSWLYTTQDVNHMMHLIYHYPNLDISPAEPDIEIRAQWPGGGNWENALSSYDTRYPSNLYDGWNSPFNGLIDVHSGLGTWGAGIYITINTPAEYTIIPFLSPTKPGYDVSVMFPKSSTPFFAFPAPPPAPNIPKTSPTPSLLMQIIGNLFLTHHHAGFTLLSKLPRLSAAQTVTTNRLLVSESDYLLVNESDYLEVN